MLLIEMYNGLDSLLSEGWLLHLRKYQSDINIAANAQMLNDDSHREMANNLVSFCDT
ncbi:uncharacterized protein RHO25_008716 [Cercospora beticola]|uniref:Uncharacterized protein n=1 Tax=Cercospora beticola TaxID=122368 RepID=A0ABZ0NWV6_CERBT|nr:hypothetical protein RHO25_008716 [Cercospora beticola]